MKKLRFSSHPTTNVGHEGPPGTTRAQPCTSIIWMPVIFSSHTYRQVDHFKYWQSRDVALFVISVLIINI